MHIHNFLSLWDIKNNSKKRMKLKGVSACSVEDPNANSGSVYVEMCLKYFLID